MNFFGFKTKSEVKDRDVGDVSIKQSDGVHKAYIPEFLYKPPFGYPRKDNIPLIRQLAKNPYIYSVVKTLCDEAADTDYKVVYKEDVEHSEELDKIIKDITRFLDNPNKNKESFAHILRAAVKDVCEVDSGVIVKTFNKKGEMVELFARDGGSFLMNPDIYGYLGNREEYVKPMNINWGITPESPDWQATLNTYTLTYKQAAAYFQYGTTAMALPVPFGRREIIYLMMNPQSNSIYGISPVQILADIIMTLIYGSNYNLDFYMNSNMPEGIITLLGANKDQITAFRERFDSQFKVKDKITGFMRKIGFKYPIVNQEAKFTPFQLDPKVMQIIEQQEWFTKLVWTCFGVTPDEMGFTENSNKAVSQGQMAVNKRRAVKPILSLLKYRIDKEIIAEWGELAFDNLEFKWEDYDLDEDLKKHDLYQKQINIGIKTAEMIAEEEGIDVDVLKKQKEEAEEKEMDKFEQEANISNQEVKQPDKKDDKKKPFEKKSVGKIALHDWVKVIGNSKSHAGETGYVKEIMNNGEEDYYLIEFQAGNDIYFNQELKFIREQVKSAGYENDLEKELVQAVKKRGKELLKALDMYGKGELDSVK